MAAVATRLADEATELFAREAAALREQVMVLTAEAARLKNAETLLECICWRRQNPANPSDVRHCVNDPADWARPRRETRGHWFIRI